MNADAGGGQNVLRVAHVIGNVVKGGVESVVFNYYRAMDRSRIQFDFIIHEDSPYEIPEGIKELGCRIFKIPSYRHLPAYIRALQEIFAREQYRIIHSHMNTLSVFALYAAKRAGVPVRIAHSHSTAGKGEWARSAMKYALRPFSRRYPTHLFACSEHAGRWLFGDRAFDEGKVTVIKNAIDTSKFRYNPETRERVRRALGIADKFVVGHVGRFMPQKNHTFLLDVFAQVHRQNAESVLLLVGDGELKPAMEEKARRLGLSECVKFLGARDDVHELYQAMDVFVLPSLYEGLPVTGVEAQCAGLPCVFSDTVSGEAVTEGSSEAMLRVDCGAESWERAILQNQSVVCRWENSCRSSEEWGIAIHGIQLQEYYTGSS